MKVYWKRMRREVHLYGMHKNAIGALNLLRAHAPGIELRVLFEAKDVMVPLRELDVTYEGVQALNTDEPVNIDRAQLAAIGK